MGEVTLLFIIFLIFSTMVNALTPQKQCIIEHEGLAPGMGNWHILENINISDHNIYSFFSLTRSPLIYYIITVIT